MDHIVPQATQETDLQTALLDGTNVRLKWNIESDMNVYWIKFKIVLVSTDLRINSTEFGHILHHIQFKIKPESI